MLIYLSHPLSSSYTVAGAPPTERQGLTVPLHQWEPGIALTKRAQAEVIRCDFPKVGYKTGFSFCLPLSVSRWLSLGAQQSCCREAQATWRVQWDRNQDLPPTVSTDLAAMGIGNLWKRILRPQSDFQIFQPFDHNSMRAEPELPRHATPRFLIHRNNER